ncbi:MAG: geranylgeranyl diphosphate synthase type II [Motiliproteus sp.]|jgi:geranylgeranyl diphosphate synthase type II
MELQQRIQPLCQRVERRLAQHFDQHSDPHTKLQQPCDSAQRLLEAMRYGLFNGGKRLRPVLVYASCLALGGQLQQADTAAAALECIHSYSLLHDDLPAMDDDALRRGKPTCHIAFDEATAILAGDALQPLAFELLSQPCGLAPATQLRMIQILALASGDCGMVAGQALDIAAEGRPQTLAQLEQMHRLKTGALIRAAVELGALASGNSDPHSLAALGDYAAAIGLAFQVQDDILDIESDTQILGKTQGADLARSKSTYPALLGLEGAKNKARELHQQALEALRRMPASAAHPDQPQQNTELLGQIADYIIARNH